MKKTIPVLTGLLVLAPAGWCAYEEKEDTTPSTNFIAATGPAAGHAARAKIEGDYPFYGGNYPFYGNVPEKCCPTAILNLTPLLAHPAAHSTGGAVIIPAHPDLKTLRVRAAQSAALRPGAVRGR